MRINLVRPQSVQSTEYLWSGEIDVLNEDPVDFTIWASSPKKLYIFSLRFEKKGANTFIVLHEDKSKTLLRIQNSLSDYDIIVHQAGVNGGTKFVAEKGKSIRFAWDQPIQEKLQIKLEILGQGKKVYPVKDFRCDFSTVETPQEIVVPREGKAPLKFTCVVELVENTKVFRLYNSKKVDFSKVVRGNRKKTRQFTLSLHYVGLSFVTTLKARRMELLYLTVVDTELAIEDAGDYYAGQARVKFINMDANHLIWTTYPVLCTTANFDELKDPDRYLLSISFTMQKDTDKVIQGVVSAV